MKSGKRITEESPGSEKKTKRLRLSYGLDDTGLDTTDSEDSSTAADSIDNDDDGSDWDVDDSDYSLDTSRDDDKGGNRNLATLF